MFKIKELDHYKSCNGIVIRSLKNNDLEHFINYQKEELLGALKENDLIFYFKHELKQGYHYIIEKNCTIIGFISFAEDKIINITDKTVKKPYYNLGISFKNNDIVNEIKNEIIILLLELVKEINIKVNTIIVFFSGIDEEKDKVFCQNYLLNGFKILERNKYNSKIDKTMKESNSINPYDHIMIKIL